jgi:hypothetical protein
MTFFFETLSVPLCLLCLLYLLCPLCSIYPIYPLYLTSAQVEGPSDAREVVYQVPDSRLLPPKLKMVCPTLVETDTCDIGDVVCLARSLFANGYVFSRGPVPG